MARTTLLKRKRGTKRKLENVEGSGNGDSTQADFFTSTNTGPEHAPVVEPFTPVLDSRPHRSTTHNNATTKAPGSRPPAKRRRIEPAPCIHEQPANIQELLMGPLVSPMVVERPAESAPWPSANPVVTLTRQLTGPFFGRASTLYGILREGIRGSAETLIDYWKGDSNATYNTPAISEGLQAEPAAFQGDSSFEDESNNDSSDENSSSTPLDYNSTGSTRKMVSKADSLADSRKSLSSIYDTYTISSHDNASKLQHATTHHNASRTRSKQNTPPPPPRTGYPRANDMKYREAYVRPDNAILRDDSAFVWKNNNERDTSRIIWDTGSRPNFISRRKALALGFQPCPLLPEDIISCGTIAGQVMAEEYIWVQFAGTGLDLKKKFISLLVVDSDDFDIIIGRSYILGKRILQKVVANGSNTVSNARPAFAIFSKKATPEQIQAIRLQREKLAPEALSAEASIISDRKRRSRQQSSMHKAPVEFPRSLKEFMSPQSVQTIVDINSSMASSMNRTPCDLAPTHSESFVSIDSSLADVPSLGKSLESAILEDGDFCMTPATTFGTHSFTGSSSHHGMYTKDLP
ncbi:hypothetical protein BJ878DRAFT_540913 [Calycina marina]|uniref:Uncharacterized protein n=1 Tax=Calycina marina TaxID=1763456 RepID=A0A9P7Z5S4_9HELO|nr:hypothetical protein BJ878DRAFT_540913 [Calycina marina]